MSEMATAPMTRATKGDIVEALLDVIDPELEQAVKEATGALPGIKKARVEWTFEPPWTSSQITEEGRDQLMALGYL